MPIIVVAVCVAFVLAAAAGLTAYYRSKPIDALPGAGPTAHPLGPGMPGVDANGNCPPSLQASVGAPPATREGPLVPAGALEAKLCTYGFDSGEIMPLEASQPLIGDADDLVEYLNRLPERPLGADGPTPTEIRVPACAGMARPAYRIVLIYRDTPPVVVDIRPNCGTASQAGAVRSLRNLTSLLGFWPPS